MATMRAKFTVESITKTEYAEHLKFRAQYSETKEDNSFSAATPSASCELTVTNKDLWGKFKPGQKFYVDFSEVPA